MKRILALAAGCGLMAAAQTASTQTTSGQSTSTHSTSTQATSGHATSSQTNTGQVAAGQTQAWRSGLSALPATPPPTTSAQDVQQFEQNMRMAASYMGTASPNSNAAQWEANRALVRRMAAYVYGLQTLSADPQLRGAVTNAQRSFNSLGFAAYLLYGMPGAVPNSSQNAPQEGGQPQESRQMLPPFALNAPDISADVSDADKSTAADLRNRYETDAAYSAGVWQNAEVLRQNLSLRGMGLNVETSTSMMRLPQQFRSAAADLRVSDWDGARTHLEQAEAVTEKIAKTVGR